MMGLATIAEHTSLHRLEIGNPYEQIMIDGMKGRQDSVGIFEGNSKGLLRPSSSECPRTSVPVSRLGPLELKLISHIPLQSMLVRPQDVHQ